LGFAEAFAAYPGCCTSSNATNAPGTTPAQKPLRIDPPTDAIDWGSVYRRLSPTASLVIELAHQLVPVHKGVLFPSAPASSSKTCSIEYPDHQADRTRGQYILKHLKIEPHAWPYAGARQPGRNRGYFT